MSTAMPAITEPLPGLPTLKPARDLPPPVMRVTELDNGLRVASEETYGQVSTVSLFVAAGSMYETPAYRGAAHYLETLAFKSSTTRSAADIEKVVTQHGLTAAATADREVLMYKVDALRGSLDEAVELLAETTTQPAFLPDETSMASLVMQYQMMDLHANPARRVVDNIQAAAYGEDSPLGRSNMCPVDQVGETSAESLRAYMDTHFTAPRMVLAGAGVDHDRLVDLAHKFFGAVPKSSSTTTEPIVPSTQYVGGEMHSSTGDDAALPMIHVSLAFPAAGWTSDDLVSACVLDVLLGGGSAFSVGGPGKGMYSRLYRELLNMHAWVESANAYSLQFAHCGLFGIQGSAAATNATGLMNLMCFHLARLAESPVTPDELARARNQLKSAVMMNLETRMILTEDIGRQILSVGSRIPPSELRDRIDAVTAEDLLSLAQRALSNPPSLASVGPREALPQYGTIQKFFADP